MALIINEKIQDTRKFGEYFSELPEQGQIMVMTYLSALRDKELADKRAQQAAEPPALMAK